MMIQHSQTGKGGTFYVEQNGEKLAEMVYTLREDGNMVIQHTEVDQALEGKHVGSQLVATGVEFARTRGIKIIPVCSFARAILQKKPEYADVLA